MVLLSDLASLFAPYESGTKVPTTNISIGGVDIADMFAPASVGAASAPDTGILVNGVDVADLFAAAGTTTKLSDTFRGYYAKHDVGQGARTASVLLEFKTDGTWTGGGRSGRWLAAGLSSSAYEIIIAHMSGDALTTNGAATYQPLSGLRSCSLVATLSGVSPAELSKSCQLLITIREIAAPTVKVDATVYISVSAETWGSSPYPP